MPFTKNGEIGADVGRPGVRKGQFVGDVEGVAQWVIGIEEPEIPLVPLGDDEYGLEALEVLPGVEVAFDIGPYARDLPGQLLGPRQVHDAGVQALELPHQHRVEHRARDPAAEIQRLLGRQVGPARFLRITEERVLYRAFFSADRHRCAVSSGKSARPRQPNVEIVVARARRILAIEGPAQRVLQNVFADTFQAGLVADDVFVVVALPQSARERGPIPLFHPIGIPFGRHGLVPMHYIRQRQPRFRRLARFQPCRGGPPWPPQTPQFPEFRGRTGNPLWLP
jgi:hypothetical protein